MTWIKLDDGFPTNPKILPLSDSAFRLYIEGLCYSGKYLTDGLLNEVIVRRLGDPKELVEAGIWEEVEGGYLIINYTEYQTPKAEVEKKREQSRERNERYRTRVTNASLTHTDNRIQNTENINNYWDEFWKIYPLKVGKGAALKAFEKAVKRATPEEIIAGAQRYAKDPNRDPGYTAHAATWLNADRWGDSLLPPKTPANGSQRLVNTPTVIPPRYTAEEAPQGSPIPESVRALLGRMGDLRQ
jgi:hypothetical protein